MSAQGPLVSVQTLIMAYTQEIEKKYDLAKILECYLVAGIHVVQSTILIHHFKSDVMLLKKVCNTSQQQVPNNT